MVKKTTLEEFPLKIEVSFKKLFDSYRNRLDSMSTLQRKRTEEILAMAEKYPILTDGFKNYEELTQYQEQVDFVLEDLFAEVLGSNEIKIASIPYHFIIIRSSERFRNIMEHAGDDIEMQLNNFEADEAYIMGCSIILNQYYGFKVDFRRPFYYNIPDANGIMRYYKVMYNGDFIDIEKTKDSIEITEDDVAELIDNFDNVNLWKEKFPPDSWKFSGFVIANMYDATTDVSLSNFKESLITMNTRNEESVEEFADIFRGIYGLSDLNVGYTIFDKERNSFISPIAEGEECIRSFILDEEEIESSHATLCDRSYHVLFENKEFYTISDVAKFHKMYPDNVLYKKLHRQGIGSAILAPLVSGEDFLGVMELVSPKSQALNSINANKLHDVMPYLVDSVRQTVEQKENEIELLIQSECTSIHPSVHWKFRQEAERVLRNRYQKTPSTFREITFNDVYPLYGQIDIKGSSMARNTATQKDLVLQLKHVRKIIDKIYKVESLPIYEQLMFRIDTYLEEIKHDLEVDTERRLLNFLRGEILPLYDHLSEKSPVLKDLISQYYKKIDASKGFVYKHRRDYDDSVTLANKRLATILDNKQMEAQQMYPHYFERFKTDGVEHNLYIGESITKQESFNKIYLYNLRLWQLQVMCEMENSYYQLKGNLPIALDVASMILVFNTSLSLRFRMDEKRFDVDGTYNARYEVVKKRVDKANIKGTDERITQPGKITIVYSQKSDEIEYLKYIGFLQHKKLLEENVEILELEDLQGVTGLKAIRVPILYTLEKDDKEDYFTYDDLLAELSD